MGFNALGFTPRSSNSALKADKVGQEVLSDLGAVLGWEPAGGTYYDDRAYKDIIRRHETGASWYQEALNTSTRGSTRSYPLVGIIAWQADKVSIIDLEGGEPKMWNIKDRAASGASAADVLPSDSSIVGADVMAGILVLALSNGTADERAGVAVFDFVGDKAARFSDVVASGGWSQSLDTDAGDLDDSLPAIVNGSVNSVAISGPLDHYPLDQYGRPGFEIACGTDGGVSVILPDDENRGKRVTDSSDTTAVDFVAWSGGQLYWSGDADEQIFAATQADIESGDGWGDKWLDSATTPAIANNSTGLAGGDALVKATASGVEVLSPNKINAAGTMRGLLTSTYLTGWMPGACVFAPDLGAYGTGSITSASGDIPDRSPAGNDAAINGTLTASAAETGADLVVLSGFSSSNYLEAPHSEDLAFGVGDFMCAGWVKTTAANGCIMFRKAASGASNYWGLKLVGGSASFQATSILTGGPSLDDDEWHFVLGCRRDGVMEVWADGALGNTANIAFNVNATDTVLRVGLDPDGASALAPASLALLRAAAYAPTPDQIRKMYEDERKLLQANAKTFLPSDTVQALDGHNGPTLICTDAGAVIHDGFKRLELIESGDIGLTSSDITDGCILGNGTDVMLVSANETVVRNTTRSLADSEIIELYKQTREWSGQGATSDATPTAIGYFYAAPGERFQIDLGVQALSDDQTESAAYKRLVRGYRAFNGDITLDGSDAVGTDDETTSSMDIGVTADTTLQALKLTVTGIASTNILWDYDATVRVMK